MKSIVLQVATHKMGDDVQNQWSQTDENGQTTVASFNADSQITSLRDPLQDITTFAYHSTLGYMTSITDPDGGTTTFEYDREGQLAATVDPLGHRTSYAYDRHGDMIAERGIFYAPDFVNNAGGIINIFVELEPQGYSTGRATELVSRIYQRTKQVIELSEREGVPTHQAAVLIAKRRIEEARKTGNVWKKPTGPHKHNAQCGVRSAQ